MLTQTVLVLAAQPQDVPLKSRSELTNYEETSRYEDVLRFFKELQRRSPQARVATFGLSHEGRALPLVILSDPPIEEPSEARASGKLIVFVMANIHAGEVEGKEAMQQIARRILTDDLRTLLDKLILLIAPIYNADGNEKISLLNRSEQNGPVGGVGTRENAQGLDLNRDFIKLEAPESLALVGVFNRWDPHLTVDLHTTDGSYHGYHLTYSIPLNPTVDAPLLAYHRDTMMPALAEAMLARHRFRTYYYGNFSGPAPKPGEPETRTWRAFTPQPRIGQNYVGLRNRLTILSEAYSHLDFRRRVEVTAAFVEEIFRYAAAHGREIRQLTQRADDDATQRGRRGPLPQIGVEYEPKPLPQPVEILVGEVTRVKNPRSGHDMTAMVEDKFRPMKMLDYGEFPATRSVSVARAYLFLREDGLQAVMDKLLAHGITVEELTAPLVADVETFVIQSVKRAERRFEGHNEVKLAGRYEKANIPFPTGTILVRTAQPLGALAAYLLEPESEDGFVTWNFLDAYLGPNRTYPIFKLMEDVKVVSQPAGESRWELVWQDEFESQRLDLSKWEFEVNARGGGNNELQYYITNNVQVKEGKLSIEARREHYIGPQGTREYTSARLRTRLKGDWKHGRFDIRAKLPKGKGMWPALWMLPTDNADGGWPNSGEIDIMELVGHEPNKVHGTLHYGDSAKGHVSQGANFTLATGTFADDFHVFRLDWEPAAMRWYVDGRLYQTQTNWHTRTREFPAPFDQRFHLILNLAVGGNWPGNPDERTFFPQTMVVDYVRVYRRNGTSKP